MPISGRFLQIWIIIVFVTCGSFIGGYCTKMICVDRKLTSTRGLNKDFIEKYEKVKYLGEGFCAIVWLVKLKGSTDDTRFVAKVFKPFNKFLVARER